MTKKIKIFGTGLLILSCLALTAFMSNGNGKLLGSDNVESLTAGDSFYDYYIPNSYRGEIHYNYQGNASGIISTFYFKGQKIENLWSPTGVAYCCFSGSTNQCKPSGDNNTSYSCHYFGLGIKFWD